MARPVNNRKDTAARRIGAKIRAIRTARGLSQTELGNMTGLSPDRVQKYENGISKPKENMLKKIASALEVDVRAIKDTDLSTPIGVMYALFEMADLYDLQPIGSLDKGEVCLYFGDGKSGAINAYIDGWNAAMSECDLYMFNSDMDEQTATEKYNNWKWTFPKMLMEKKAVEAEERRKKRITDLERELAALKSGE